MGIQGNRRGWSTENEIIFLRGLGGWKDPGHWSFPHNRWVKGKIALIQFDPLKRLRLLKNYKVAIPHRKDWGRIEVGKVLEFLNEELRLLSPL